MSVELNPAKGVTPMGLGPAARAERSGSTVTVATTAVTTTSAGSRR